MWMRGEEPGSGTCGQDIFVDANCSDDDAQSNWMYCKRAENPAGAGVKCFFTPGNEETGTPSSCAQVSSCSDFKHPTTCNRSSDPEREGTNCMWRSEEPGTGMCGQDIFVDANCADVEAQSDCNYCKRAENPTGSGIKCIFTPANEEAGAPSSCAQATSCSEFNNLATCNKSADPASAGSCVWSGSICESVNGSVEWLLYN